LRGGYSYCNKFNWLQLSLGPLSIYAAQPFIFCTDRICGAGYYNVAKPSKRECDRVQANADWNKLGIKKRNWKSAVI